MKLAMMRPGPAPVAILGEEVLDLTRLDTVPAAPRSLTALLAAGETALQAVRSAIEGVEDAADARRDEYRASGILKPVDSVEFAAPFPRPGLVFFTGGNYKAHLDEVAERTGLKIEPPKEPIGFIKNSNAVVGPGDPIILPAKYPNMIDFEVEFSFVVGKPCHAISESEAMDYIAGYTLVNDISARDWNESAQRPDGSIDLTMPTFGKQFPTFCPMGPTFVTCDELPDPNNVDVRLTLNGEVMQDANTSDLLFGFEKILSYFSQFFRFQPGDVLTTGSPPGVGFARQPPLFLKPGDEVAVSATAVGTLVNRVEAA